MTISFTNARFFTGAHKLHQCPPDTAREVAVAGRSNAGKSSALNAITGIKGLARTSKQPGRTQQINYFELGEQQYLVDLPGYGFAKVPPKMRAHWDQTLSAYFDSRQSLQGLVVIMDIRHPLRDLDWQLIEWANELGIPVHCLLTKSDKQSNGKNAAVLEKSRRLLAGLNPDISIQLFSAVSGRGIDEVRKVIRNWLSS
jgi:GTP-binding protein